MTPREKLNKVARLCEELQDEKNDVIVESRIQALAKALDVSPWQCALLYWALKDKGEFFSIFGADIRINFRSPKNVNKRD